MRTTIRTRIAIALAVCFAIGCSASTYHLLEAAPRSLPVSR